MSKNQDRITHGASKTKMYKSWMAMKSRCFKPNSKHYESYGGRGILVCDRWKKFENFLEDMGERPEGMTLERIDNNGDYCPENCKWATRKEQQNNRRVCRYITFNGETLTLTQWAERAGISYQSMQKRLKNCTSLESALTKPKSQGIATASG